MSQATPTRRLAQDPERVYRLRMRAGMSQRQLAAAAGITDATVCRIETGVNGASAQSLRKLAKALGCNVEDLMPAPDIQEDREAVSR